MMTPQPNQNFMGGGENGGGGAMGGGVPQQMPMQQQQPAMVVPGQQQQLQAAPQVIPPSVNEQPAMVNGQSKWILTPTGHKLDKLISRSMFYIMEKDLTRQS